MLRDKLKKLPIPITILLSIILVFVFYGALDGSGLLLSKYANLRSLYEYTGQAICETITLIVFLIIAALFGFTYIFKSTGVGFFKSFYIGGFLLTYCIFDSIGQLYLICIQHKPFQATVPHMIIYIIAVFLVGLVEELVFRGVILNLLIDRFPKTNAGILWAIIIDGVLFGLMHYGNMLSGVKFLSCTAQVTSAAMLGIILAAVYARTGNFWIVVIFHAWIDAASLFASSFVSGAGIVDSINNYNSLSFIGTIVLLIPAVVLVRKSKLTELTARANGCPALENEETGKRLGIVSMILGILGICLSCIGYLAGIGVVGILGGIWAKKLKKENNGPATAGIICSIISIFLSIIMVVVLLIFYGNMDPSYFSKYNDMFGN